VKVEQMTKNRTPPVLRVFVNGPSGKFTFPMPAGLRLKGGSTAKVKLANLEGNRMITFTVLDPTPCGNQPLNADTYREVVEARYAKGKVLEQLCPAAGGRQGLGFDVRWETTNGLVQFARIVFIPSSAGVLEFDVNSGPQDFNDLRYVLEQMLVGFRTAGADEELQVPKVFDESYERSDAGRLQKRSEGRSRVRFAVAWRAS
jgi:hypothetical protein